ncbi:MAG: ATP-binding protein, partial [Tannerella sp.]|nr:ATP-binding protein [Tannerella sp.]
MTIAEPAGQMKLSYIKANYQKILKQTGISTEEALHKLLIGEYENRIENGNERRIKSAKFPYKKYLVDFDRNKYSDEFLPEFAELETLEFINKNENIILIGTAGAGKTHYSIALGIAACMAGKSVFYASVSNLVTELKETMSKQQITNFRRKFERYSL